MRLILAASALVLATAGVAHAEVRNLSGFTQVSASAGTDVEVTVGGAFRVEVTGRDADRIITRVSGDTLIVEPVRGFSWRGRQANIRVSMPRAEGFSASSGSDLVATGSTAATFPSTLRPAPIFASAAHAPLSGPTPPVAPTSTPRTCAARMAASTSPRAPTRASTRLAV